MKGLWPGAKKYESISRIAKLQLKINLLPSADITLPSAKSPWLIFTPSLNLHPVALVFFERSEPAKSTKWNLALVVESPLKYIFLVKLQ